MVTTLTESNFAAEVKESKQLYLVDFWAAWCGPCQMMGPIVDAVAEEYAGKISVGKLNVDENRSLALEYGIQSIPTLLFFRNGNVVHKAVGAQPKAQLEEIIQYLLGQ